MKRHTFLPALAAVPAASGGSGATPALGSFSPAAQAAAPAAAPVAPPVAPPVASPVAPPPVPAPQAADSGSLLGSLPDVSFSWSGYFEALAILCFVLALLWALLWLIKRRGNGGFFSSSTPSMRIESRLALGPKKWLMVVRYLDRRLVLGVTDKSINLLTELYDQEFASDPQPEKTAGKLSLAGKSAPDAQGTAKSGTDKGRDGQSKEGGLTLSFASLLKQDKGDSSQ